MPPLLQSPDEIREILATKSIVVFDLETNGFEVSTDILEIGAIKYAPGTLTRENLQPAEIMQHLIYFDGTPNMEAFGINRLDPVALKTEGMPLAQALQKLKDFTHDSVIVGQNVFAFDMPIVTYHGVRNDIMFSHAGVVDTLLLARTQIKVPSYRLADLARYFVFQNIPSHRALDDVMATAELLVNLVYPKRQATLL